MPETRTWKILNVDDNEAGRYAITKVLSRAGFEILEAANGADALRMVTEQHPDLVLLDVNLPDISGFEVCKQIKQDKNTASIPVLHLSATYVSPQDRIEGLTGRADGYLVQPVDPGELVETIRVFLRIREMEDALRKSEERFRGLFDAVTSGIAIFEVRFEGMSEKDYIVRDFNKIALEIEGKKDEVIGRSVLELRPAIDEYGIIAIFQRVWKTGVPELFSKKTHPDKDHTCWYENRVFRLQNGEVVWVYNDVTEKKRAEEIKESLVNEVKQKNSELDRFTYTVSHDLKCPLITIKGFLALARQDLQQNNHDQVQHHLDRISSAAEKMEQLIFTLLELSRSGKSVEAPVMIPFTTLVNEAADTSCTHP